MKNLINKLTAWVSGVALFAVGVAMAGLGFAFMGMLALFAVIGFGLALLAAPFVGLAHNPAQTEETEQAAGVSA